MKKILIGIITFTISATLMSAEIDVNTKVSNVTIYHSGALVHRAGTADLKVGVNELVFKNLSSKIVLNTLKITNKEVTILNKSIIRKLTAEEFSQLIDKKEALNNQLTLFETKFNESGFVTEVEDLEKMMAFYSSQVLEIKKSLRQVEREIETAKKLEDISINNENAAILKITISLAQKLTKPLELKYVVGGIGWSPAYEISVNNTSDNKIELKYLAKVMSQTGENWDNVKINLSSSFPLESPTALPKPDGPWVLRGNSSNYYVQKNAEEDIMQANQMQQIKRLEGVEYEKISMPSFLKPRVIEGLHSIKSNSTVFSFPILQVDLPAKFYYYGFPSIDPEVYLISEIMGWDTYGFVDGIANISFNNNDVGKTIIRFSEFQDTMFLPIGKDNSVFMKREEIADQKFYKESGNSKKKKTTQAYEYVLKNNNPFPVVFELFDQVPISQTKSAEVEIEKLSKAKHNKETGEVLWQLDLRPGESVTKELVFNIEIDSDYSYYSLGQESNISKRYQYMANY